MFNKSHLGVIKYTKGTLSPLEFFLSGSSWGGKGKTVVLCPFPAPPIWLYYMLYATRFLNYR